MTCESEQELREYFENWLQRCADSIKWNTVLPPWTEFCCWECERIIEKIERGKERERERERDR